MPRKQCVPFVVLFTGRSGSTYLVESLDRHTGIRAEKEMFAAMGEQGCPAADQLAWARSFLAAQPHEGCLAVGYKTKVRDIPDADGFRELLAELGVSVLLLQRRNAVKQAVSLINAVRLQERTGDWNLYSEGDRGGSEAIEPAEFERYLGRIEQDQAAAEAYAATLDRPLLRIWYEDMLRDEASFFRRIFEFLGVPFEVVRGQSLKNTSDDLRASLANFDELRSRYEDTHYAAMFDENIVPASPLPATGARAHGSGPAAPGRIIVSGLAGLHPVGGMAWHYLQYVIGLQRMGFEVVYHEDTRSWPYHPLERRQTSEGEYSASFLGEYFARFAPGLADRWHYRHLREKSYGMSGAAFDEFARSADFFVNVSGAGFIPDALAGRCLKVFIDTDPGYNQIILSTRPEWSPGVDRWADLVDQHDRHFTYAELIGRPECGVPDVGLDWRPTRMPIVLDLWSASATPPAPPDARWTTIMTWNPFKGELHYDGRVYGSKADEFGLIERLPEQSSRSCLIALGGKEAPADRLRSAGWEVVDGPAATLSAQSYRDFIARSYGECSVAKNVYVAMRTGWFSERSACYLAAGRPVVVQDTGFSAILPTGEGLLCFTNGPELAEAVAQVEGDYRRHAWAAREVAIACFESSAVLGRLLEDAAASPAPRARRSATAAEGRS